MNAAPNACNLTLSVTFFRVRLCLLQASASLPPTTLRGDSPVPSAPRWPPRPPRPRGHSFVLAAVEPGRWPMASASSRRHRRRGLRAPLDFRDPSRPPPKRPASPTRSIRTRFWTRSLGSTRSARATTACRPKWRSRGLAGLEPRGGRPAEWQDRRPLASRGHAPDGDAMRVARAAANARYRSDAAASRPRGPRLPRLLRRRARQAEARARRARVWRARPWRSSGRIASSSCTQNGRSRTIRGWPSGCAPWSARAARRSRAQRHRRALSKRRRGWRRPGRARSDGGAVRQAVAARVEAQEAQAGGGGAHAAVAALKELQDTASAI